jgi:hypothetical protein
MPSDAAPARQHPPHVRARRCERHVVVWPITYLIRESVDSGGVVQRPKNRVADLPHLLAVVESEPHLPNKDADILTLKALVVLDLHVETRQPDQRGNMSMVYVGAEHLDYLREHTVRQPIRLLRLKARQGVEQTLRAHRITPAIEDAERLGSRLRNTFSGHDYEQWLDRSLITRLTEGVPAAQVLAI